MIGWLLGASVLIGIISIVLIDCDEMGIGIAALVLCIILFILSIVIPTKEEQYIESFEAGYYQMDTDKVIEEYNDTIKDVAVALNKENMNVVKIEKIDNDAFKLIVVSSNEDKIFTTYAGLVIKEIVEAGWLIPATEEGITQTETTTEEVEKIHEGYYYVADKLSIARDYDKEASLLMFKLAEMKQTHVRIIVNNGQVVASIPEDDILYILKYDDVLKMIEEESLILDNELKYVSVNETA